MNYVAIDLGASNTRYTTTDGKVYYLPNNAYFVKDIEKNLEDEAYNNKPEDNLDVTIYKEDGDASDFFPMRALVGVMSERYGKTQTRPSQMMKKVDQKINYLSVVLCVALSKIKNTSISDTVNVFIALPPSEVQNDRHKMKNNLIGQYRVVFNTLDSMTVQFNINNVACYEESRLALMQFLFDDRHPERLGKYTSCNILSVDIGASTTDLVVFKRGQFMNNTGTTLKIGGNVLRSKVSKQLVALTGDDVPQEVADTCIAEGRLYRGNETLEIADVLNEAKEEVASRIVAELDSYFGSFGMALSQINYIVVSGGGSMASSYIDDKGVPHEVSGPMSDYITNELQNKCQGIEVLYFGDEPRAANIRGLGMLAESRSGEIAGE